MSRQAVRKQESLAKQESFAPSPAMNDVLFSLAQRTHATHNSPSRMSPSARENGSKSQATAGLNDSCSAAPHLSTEQLQAIRDSHDLTIAELFITLFGDLHRYVLDDGYWLTWLGTHWAGDTGKQILYNHLAELRNELDNRQYNNSLIEAIIRKLSNQKSLAAIVKSLEVNSEVTLLSADLDAKAHLIAFANAVYNTDTGQVFTAPELILPMYLTKRMDVWYKPTAKCPKWNDFLLLIFNGDMELIRFVQKAASLSLCGNVREERLFFAYGTGANGKTTFFEVLNKLYHSYHQEIDPSILIKNKHQDQRMLLENIANLKGIRFATSNEIPEKSTYNDMAIKQLCSRDTLTAKKIYQSVMSFQPSHTLWIRSNHKPLFNVHDGGILRRLALIPFSVRIPPEARIERFEDVLLKERSGILNWLLDGWKMYQKERLNPYPDAVSIAINEYAEECDTLKQFIAENYVTISTASTLMKDFTARYNEWCKLNHYPPSNSRALASELRNAGWKVVSGAYNHLQIKQMGLIESNS